MDAVTVGRCIYCRSSEGPLSREHVIPYGLNGDLVLQAASCAACASITSRFEQGVLRRMLGTVRPALGFRSRRKPPAVLPVQIDRGWGFKTEHVEASNFPAIIMLPVLKPPAYLTGEVLEPGVEMQIAGIDWAVFRDRLPMSHPLNPTGVVGIRASLQFDPLDFARLLAKIGYGAAVAQVGLDAFEEVYVLPLILGAAKDAGTWVGSSKDIPKIRVPFLHYVTMRRSGSNVREIHAYIRLFAAQGAPEYIVVLGRLIEPKT